MGSGGSRPKPLVAITNGQIGGRLAPDGKPLEEWDAEEVTAWFNTLVADLQRYRSTLLPDEGCIVAQWTEQYLVTKSLPATDAMRLIAYRNKAASRALKSVQLSAPKEGASLGVFNQEDTTAGTPAAAKTSPTLPDTTATNTTTATMTITKSMYLQSTQSSSITQQQQQPATAANRTSRQESLMALLTKGVKLARTGIQHLGPSLPFPGAEAANLVLVLLDLVDGAIANHANLSQLQQRAVAFLDILDAYQQELSNLRPPRYKGVVDDFKEVLQGIIAYTRVYVERNCIMRLLTLGSDQEAYQELVDSLASLCEATMVHVAADTNARLQAVQRSVEAAAAALSRVAEYQDPAAGARALVSDLGGLDAVLGDEEKLQKVKLQLDVGSQVTIKVVESLMLSYLDRGPQRLIRHPDLRLFWMRQYDNIVEVPWYDFWEQFPEQLRENPADPAVVAALGALLAGDPAKAAFKRGVERGNKDVVSVWELKLAFSGEEALPPQVLRLLAAEGANTTATTTAAAAAAAAFPAAPPAAGCDSGGGGAARCQLPPLVSYYTGREDEAAAVAEHLLHSGSLVLLAQGGMGKSCLAVDVGWRLVQGRVGGGGGVAPGVVGVGVALWVDLREASSGAEVEARFCASLGMQAEKLDNTVRILAALKALCPLSSNGTAPPSGGPDPQWRQQQLFGAPRLEPAVQAVHVLVVVDNAEDALLLPDVAEGLRGLLSKILQGIPSVRLLVTSRVTLGLGGQHPFQLYQTQTQRQQQQPQQQQQASGATSERNLPLLPEHLVGAIQRHSAVQLIQKVAEDLTAGEAAAVADACKCVPLPLCLVAEALAAGRLTLEDLAKLQAQDSGELSSEGTNNTVRLVLGGLKRQHQQAAAQLAVFPSVFDEEGAAAVAASTLPQAHALLAVLHQYSVVQRSSGQHYVMHMVVRRQAAEVGRRADASLRPRVEGRFVDWMLGVLRECGVMYRTAKEWRLALTIARDHQADVSKLLELLSVAAAAAVAAEGSGRQAAAAAAQEKKCHWDAADVAVATCTDDLRQLMEGLGMLRRMEVPCVALLKRLGGAPAPAPAAACASASVDGGGGRGPSPAAGTRHHQLYLQQPQPQQEGPQWGHLPEPAAPPASAAAAAAQLSQPRQQQQQSSEHANPPPVPPVPQQQQALQQEQQQQALQLKSPLAQQQEQQERRRQLAVAAVLYMLAWVRVRGRVLFKEAEADARQSWELRAALLGSEHPDSVVSLYILAAALGYLRRYSEAEVLNRQVLEIQLRLMGRMHVDTAYSINGLAVCVDKQGRFSEAEALYREALDIRREMLGERHPATAGSLNNLAGSICFQGRRSEAEALYRQALETRRAVLGDEHPDTVDSLAHLTGCIIDEGRLSEAEPLLRQTLALRERVLGRDHPDTLASLTSLAACVYGMEDREREAEQLYREVVRMSACALGRGHPSTRSRVVSLGHCVEAQGRGFDAEAVLDELLTSGRGSAADTFACDTSLL